MFIVITNNLEQKQKNFSVDDARTWRRKCEATSIDLNVSRESHQTADERVTQIHAFIYLIRILDLKFFSTKVSLHL
jgi:hypothetical protein